MLRELGMYRYIAKRLLKPLTIDGENAYKSKYSPDRPKCRNITDLSLMGNTPVPTILIYSREFLTNSFAVHIYFIPFNAAYDKKLSTTSNEP